MPKSRHHLPDNSVYEDPPPGSSMLVYLRHSPGDEQDAFSQRIRLRKWVTEERGWLVYPGGWFEDEARSGGSTEGRDQFHQMIALARKLAKTPNRPAGVAIWKFDRFARNVDDSILYAADLRRMGYTLVSMEDQIPKNSLAPVFQSVIAWKAQQDLFDISANVRRTFDTLKEMGYEHGGRPARGLKAVKVPIAVKPTGETRYGIKWEANTDDPVMISRIQQAWEMKAQDRSHKQILKGPLHGVYKSANCLSTFFRNHRYVDAGLISEALFQQVQAVIQKHSSTRSHKGVHSPGCIGSTYLLSGLVWCSCGANMVATTVSGRGHRYRYYECNNRRLQENCPCQQSRIRADCLEAAILDQLLAFLNQPDPAAAFARTCREEPAMGDDSLSIQVAHLHKILADLERQIDRLAEVLTEDDSLERTRAILKEKEAERKQVKADLCLAEAELNSQRLTCLTAEAVIAFLAGIRESREKEACDDLKEALKRVIARVTVCNREYRVEYKPAYRPWLGPGFASCLEVPHTPHRRRQPPIPVENDPLDRAIPPLS